MFAVGLQPTKTPPLSWFPGSSWDRSQSCAAKDSVGNFFPRKYNYTERTLVACLSPFRGLVVAPEPGVPCLATGPQPECRDPASASTLRGHLVLNLATSAETGLLLSFFAWSPNHENGGE